MSDLYAVVGNPIDHSKSPQIHAAFARETRQALRYERLLAPLDSFRQTVEAFRARGGRGLNVTLPFKEEAFALADEKSARAIAAGAANTLRFEGDRTHADNTDGAGLVRDLSLNHAYALRGRRVLIMGAGGAARGVVGPLAAEAPAAITIANRSMDKALELGRRFGIEACAYGDLADRRFDLIVNATSASLDGALPPLPPAALAGVFAYDMMYGREDTAFLAFARQHGAARCADGLGMLVEQAAESFFIWRGVRPATQPVLAALRADLR